MTLQPVDVNVTPKEKFREYLRLKNMRLTPERETIVEQVFEAHDHFDADQLVEQVSKLSGKRRVSRSTVYRTLTSLEEAGLIRKVARANDREIWEHDYGYPAHDHLICSECGELQEFQSAPIADILNKVAADYGFLMDGHRLEVSGICFKCRAKPKRSVRKTDMI